MDKNEHITLNSKIEDVMNHPAFEGFGQLLFSWNDYQRRGYPKDEIMKNVTDYDLWFTHPDPQTQVDVLNRLIDDANKGNKIFYDIYSQKEKLKDPYKKYTGLVYLRGKPGAPFMIFVPGGGYVFVGIQREGLPIAKIISEKGYNAFVLRYRVNNRSSNYQHPSGPDLIQAVKFILKNHDELEVSKDNYSLWGGSAGALTVSNVVYGEGGINKNQKLNPAAAIIAYTVFSEDLNFNKNDTPAFFIVGKNDWIVPWQIVKNRAEKMKKAGCIVEDHIIDNLEHGFGVGLNTPAEGWINKAINFWERNMK